MAPNTLRGMSYWMYHYNSDVSFPTITLSANSLVNSLKSSIIVVYTWNTTSKNELRENPTRCIHLLEITKDDIWHGLRRSPPRTRAKAHDIDAADCGSGKDNVMYPWSAVWATPLGTESTRDSLERTEK